MFTQFSAWENIKPRFPAVFFAFLSLGKTFFATENEEVNAVYKKVQNIVPLLLVKKFRL